MSFTRRFVVGSASFVPFLSAFAQKGDLALLNKPGPLGDRMLGDEKAPITIIEYASYTCGHCVRFHAETFPEVKKRYIDTGKVKFIFREFPFDNLAAAMSVLARCTPEPQYYPMVSVLFGQNASIMRSQDPANSLRAIARQAGMSNEGFEACFKDQKLADGVNYTRDTGEKVGVEATPTFFINGKKVSGFMTIEEFEKELKPLLN